MSAYSRLELIDNRERAFSVACIATLSGAQNDGDHYPPFAQSEAEWNQATVERWNTISFAASNQIAAPLFGEQPRAIERGYMAAPAAFEHAHEAMRSSAGPCRSVRLRADSISFDLDEGERDGRDRKSTMGLPQSNLDSRISTLNRRKMRIDALTPIIHRCTAIDAASNRRL